MRAVSEALECGSLLPLSFPQACLRGTNRRLYPKVFLESLLSQQVPASKLAERKSGSKLPHSKASLPALDTPDETRPFFEARC